MHLRFEDIVANAMQLPMRDRIRLAQQLISTLDEETEENVEELWSAEATRRLDELRSGKAKGIPADVAFARARDAMRR